MPDSRLPSAVYRLPARSDREGGFTMVGVVLGMMLLAILIATVAPAIGKISQRDREAELVFRGRQYARAISIFQRRFGRYPNTLKELSENQPRSIRQLWKDPMCNCPDWHVILLNSPEAQGNPLGGPPRTPGPSGAPPTPTPASPFGPPSGEPIGPIVGVASKVHKESITEWRGQKFYDQWLFRMGDADKEQMGTNVDPLGIGGNRNPGK